MRKWTIALIVLIIQFLIPILFGNKLPVFVISLIVVIITVEILILFFILIFKIIKKFINYKREQLQVQKDILNELRKDKAEY